MIGPFVSMLASILIAHTSRSSSRNAPSSGPPSQFSTGSLSSPTFHSRVFQQRLVWILRRHLQLRLRRRIRASPVGSEVGELAEFAKLHSPSVSAVLSSGLSSSPLRFISLRRLRADLVRGGVCLIRGRLLSPLRCL